MFILCRIWGRGHYHTPECNDVTGLVVGIPKGVADYRRFSQGEGSFLLVLRVATIDNRLIRGKMGWGRRRELNEVSTSRHQARMALGKKWKKCHCEHLDPLQNLWHPLKVPTRKYSCYSCFEHWHATCAPEYRIRITTQISNCLHCKSIITHWILLRGRRRWILVYLLTLTFKISSDGCTSPSSAGSKVSKQRFLVPAAIVPSSGEIEIIGALAFEALDFDLGVVCCDLQSKFINTAITILWYMPR